MKFCKVYLLFILFALINTVTKSLAQDDANSPKRIALRRPAVVGKTGKTTTTAPPPPAYDDEGDYPEENPEGENGEEGEEEQAVSSTTTTSTEAPKKIGPVIRPFRSNDDFLNSLKRRQMIAKKHLAEKQTPKARPVPVSENGDQAEESAPAPVAPSKGYKSGSNGSNRRKQLKPVDDATAEESEQQKEESKLKRPPSRLSLRKRS